jgi:hypothetical protein
MMLLLLRWRNKTEQRDGRHGVSKLTSSALNLKTPEPSIKEYSRGIKRTMVSWRVQQPHL